MKRIFYSLMLSAFPLMADNQTDTLSPVFPEASLPFTIEVELASFSLPTGLQAYASAVYKGKWVLLAGRTNGLHGFDQVGNNFPPNFQNTTVYMVDPKTGVSIERSLSDSGLSQSEIDALSATASEFFQKKSTLYVVGGYGIDTGTGRMGTKDTLTAIDLEDLAAWVEGKKDELVIRQVAHPLLKVTGGELFQNTSHDPFLLMVGQNFTGLYRDDSNGAYTNQIRTFWLNDDGNQLSIFPHKSSTTDPDYRRRDLNIVPVWRDNQPAYVIFSGVFTLTNGVWTVPITVLPDGSSFEPDPTSLDTFKQAMNHYDCPKFGLYSTHSKEMYVILPGGISYGFFSGGVFQTDAEIPFINQITTIKIDKEDNYTQYLMNAEFPFIASTGSNPGNQLLFGAGAQFFVHEGISTFRNGVIQLDKIDSPTIIGYIAGGIMSTLPNTNVQSDTTVSPYVFIVRLIPK